MKLSISPPKRVIVQSMGGEPADLFLHAIDSKGDFAYVGILDARRPLGVPSDQVFVFSDESMRRLSEAYASGNPSLVENIYADVECSCIKYQISVDSPHDQERLTHSRGASEGRDDGNAGGRIP